MSDCWELPHGSAFDADAPPVYGWRFEQVQWRAVPAPPQVWLGNFPHGEASTPAACPTRHRAPHADCDLCGLRMVRDTDAAIRLAVLKENEHSMKFTALVRVKAGGVGFLGDTPVGDVWPVGTCIRVSHLRLIGPGFTPREDVADELTKHYGLGFYSMAGRLWGHSQHGIARVAQQYPSPVMAS